MIFSQKRGHVPTIVISCGGFGLLVLITLKKLVVESYGDLRNARMRLLGIDAASPDYLVKSEKEGVTADDLRLLGSEFVRVIFEPPPDFRIDHFPELGRHIPSDVEMVLDDPKICKEGCLKIASLGRLCWDFNYNQGVVVQKQILALFENIFSMDEIAQHVGEDRLIRVFIVGSCCGGTGRAMLIPLGYAVQGMKRDGMISFPTEVTGLVGLPEIFSSTDQRLGANAYQWLRELQYYSRSDTTYESRYPNWTHQKPLKMRPFDRVYLFSRSNAVIVMRDKTEVANLIAQRILLDSLA
jgi:hypothetical protein